MNHGRHRRPPGWREPPGRRSFRRPADPDAEHLRLIRLRALVLSICLMLAAAALGARLVVLHVIQAAALEQMANRQHQGTMVLEPRRGRILDRLGRPLAVNVEVESVFAVPSRIDDPATFARTVAPVLGLKAGEVMHLFRPDRHFVWLARKVSPQTAAALRAKALGEQAGFVTESRREYPNGMLAAHVVGFAGVDNQGLAGAEIGFDRYLRGRAGFARLGRDAMGRPRMETRTILREPQDGADVVLTIDQVVQHIAERELDRALAATRAARGIVLVMDPETGEMLAMAASPRFDPNAFNRTAPQEWNNPAISAAYEPGSTFKIVLAAAALDAGAVNETEVFANTGTLRVPGRHVIREAQGRAIPRPTLGDVVRLSSNVGAAMVATRLGPGRYYEAIRRFGFGEPTGIDLPGEAAGIVPPPSQWLGPTLQTMGFGQGISVTPIQLLVAGAALARDGMLVRPHVVRAVRDTSGRAIDVTAPAPIRQATSPSTARKVMAMMEEAVLSGTGTQARLDGYVVAGKTGTAQKPSQTGGYRADAHVASFLGIVSTDRPRLAILIVIDEPKGHYYGGVVAAPVFSAVASQVLWHLRIAPSAEPASRP